MYAQNEQEPGNVINPDVVVDDNGSPLWNLIMMAFLAWWIEC
jgi:hypothetical protein